MPAQAYQCMCRCSKCDRLSNQIFKKIPTNRSPSMPTPDLLPKALVAALTGLGGLPGGMTRSLNLPNMSAHGRRGEQSHSRTINRSTTRIVERASHGRRQLVTYGIFIFQYPLPILSLESPWITLHTNGGPPLGPRRSRSLNHLFGS
jgi:hypothetical protein